MSDDRKQYRSVQEMLDDLAPEFAEEYRAHMKRPSVRLRNQWHLLMMVGVRKWVRQLFQAENRQ